MIQIKLEGDVESYEYHGSKMPASNLHQHAELVTRGYCFLARFENVNKVLSSKNYYFYDVTLLNSIRLQRQEEIVVRCLVISSKLWLFSKEN